MFRRDVPIHFFHSFIILLAGCATSSGPAPKSTNIGADQRVGDFIKDVETRATLKSPMEIPFSRGATEGIFLNSSQRILMVKDSALEMVDFEANPPQTQRFLAKEGLYWSRPSWDKKTARIFLTGSVPPGASSPSLISRQDRADIYTFDFEKGQKTQFTRSVAFNGEGSLSNDGKWLAFSSAREGDFEIYLVRSNGDGLLRVTKREGYDGDPAFSPDSKYLIWRAYRGPRKDLSDLVLARLDLGGAAPRILEQRLLTSKKYALFLTPSFLTDSKHIVFASNMADRSQLDLFVADVDFQCARRITDSRDQEIFPTISTEGKFLLWTSKAENGAPRLMMAPFSFSRAPCDGSQVGTEAESVEFKGVGGR